MTEPGDADPHFYERLPAVDRFAEVPDFKRYVPVPDSWCVVITDVVGSTRAIEAGRYKDVNALGVGSIVALRNAVAGIELPFVFGGDGATVLAPESRRTALEGALRGVRSIARRAFDLDLRAGIVRVRDLRAEGHDVRVARFRLGSHATLALLAGDGVAVAERWVKDPVRGVAYAVADGPETADLSGFECRWQPIPARHGVVLALLVRALGDDPEQRTDIYRAVLERIDAILSGDPGCPVSVDTLRLGSLGASYRAEASLRSGEGSGLAHRLASLRATTQTLIGRLLFATGGSAGGFDGATYRAEVVENTDYRKFDEMLRMVIDVTDEQRGLIEAWLGEQRAAGRIVHGCHASSAALMTCAISSYSGDHLHFVDGAEGGYALAAKQLKLG